MAANGTVEQELHLEPRLLFADDNEDWCKAIVDNLTLRGYAHVKYVTDPTRVIGVAMDFQATHVFVDLDWRDSEVGKGEMDGHWILREIEKEPYCRNMYVAMLTSQLTHVDQRAQDGTWVVAGKEYDLLLKSHPTVFLRDLVKRGVLVSDRV